MIMQMIYRLRLAAKKVEGDRDFEAQMKEEPARSLFPIPGILSTLKEEKQKKEEELNPEEAIVSIVENTVLEMKEEEEKEKQKAEEIKNKNKNMYCHIKIEIIKRTILIRVIYRRSQLV